MKKQINNYENYTIYSNGEVFNETTQKFLKGSIGEGGYKYYRLSKNGQKKMFYAHRLVAEAFIDNPLNYPVVNHIDGNKLNNNIENLEWVTYSGNTQHWRDSNAVKHSKMEYYIEDLPNEIWKPYKNYYVSSKGRIRNAQKNNLLKPSITSGYYKVRLSENNMVQDWLVHKLVYIVFTSDNDLNNYVIDHIDGNKLNNDINNLRKITVSQNTLAALYETKTNNSAKEVLQYNLDGELLGRFPSAREAARTLNLDSSTISKVCRGVNKTHGGFIFKFSE